MHLLLDCFGIRLSVRQIKMSMAEALTLQAVDKRDKFGIVEGDQTRVVSKSFFSKSTQVSSQNLASQLKSLVFFSTSSQVSIQLFFSSQVSNHTLTIMYINRKVTHIAINIFILKICIFKYACHWRHRGEKLKAT